MDNMPDTAALTFGGRYGVRLNTFPNNGLELNLVKEIKE